MQADEERLFLRSLPHCIVWDLLTILTVCYQHFVQNSLPAQAFPSGWKKLISFLPDLLLC